MISRDFGGGFRVEPELTRILSRHKHKPIIVEKSITLKS